MMDDLTELLCPSCKSPNSIIGIRQSVFNGSYYNYKKMISRLYPNREASEVSNCLLEDGSPSIPSPWCRGNLDKECFTGIVIFHDSRLIMKKGDTYRYPIKCKCRWKIEAEKQNETN